MCVHFAVINTSLFPICKWIGSMAMAAQINSACSQRFIVIKICSQGWIMAKVKMIFAVMDHFRVRYRDDLRQSFIHFAASFCVVVAKDDMNFTIKLTQHFEIINK